MTFYFEDFSVGRVFELGQCAVSEAEIVAFATGTTRSPSTPTGSPRRTPCSAD